MAVVAGLAVRLPPVAVSLRSLTLMMSALLAAGCLRTPLLMLPAVLFGALPNGCGLD